jgi:hypothetical protein
VLPGYVTVLSPQVSNETHSKICLLLYLVYYIFAHGVNRSLNTLVLEITPVNLNTCLDAYFYVCPCMLISLHMCLSKNGYEIKFWFQSMESASSLLCLLPF